MKALRRSFAALVIALLWTAQVKADKLPVLAHLDLTGEKSVTDQLPSLNAEVLITLEKSGKYQLVSEEQLADKLIMGPAENLKFCDLEPSCIASMGATVKARWLLYGEVKLSFDGTKTLVHLVLIDVKGEKLAKEKHGQFSRDNAAIGTGDILRTMLGLKPRKPKAVAHVVEPPPSDRRGSDKNTKKKSAAAAISKSAPKMANSPWKDPLFWSTAGAGVFCLATATTLGLLSADRQDQARALAIEGDPLGAEDRFHDAEDMAFGANILFGVGGAAMVAAVVFLVLDITDDTPASTVPMLSCNSSSCSGWLSVSF